MKRTFRILPILLAALLYGCAGSSTALPEDFTAKIYTPDYASGFDIRGNDNDASTLITIRNPWQGGADVEQYLLVLRGDVPADRLGLPEVKGRPLHGAQLPGRD